LEVAIQRPVARVSVVKRLAIFICLARAPGGYSYAHSLFAVVAHRTRVSIVALASRRHEHASDLIVALIFGALVGIRAHNGLAVALAVDT